MGNLHESGDFTWRVSDFEELVGVLTGDDGVGFSGFIPDIHHSPPLVMFSSLSYSVTFLGLLYQLLCPLIFII